MRKKITAFLTVLLGGFTLFYFELFFEEDLQTRILGDLVGILLIIIGFVRFSRKTEQLPE
ncbi:MAG: hypothetical protein MI784_05230 [Cytophagales bacterium]|nr:hypothetical protein [Cytophagales bacterium]